MSRWGCNIIAVLEARPHRCMNTRSQIHHLLRRHQRSEMAARLAVRHELFSKQRIPTTDLMRSLGCAHIYCYRCDQGQTEGHQCVLPLLLRSEWSQYCRLRLCTHQATGGQYSHEATGEIKAHEIHQACNGSHNWALGNGTRRD